MPQQFASDNNAGICPEALAALTRANAEGHVPGYGDDEWTQKACARLRELFETDAQVFFVFNGTAANGLGTGYTPGGVGVLTEGARRHGLKVHMDGARFANALATLQCSPADLSWRAGVDVLCLGGVKNGLAVGEAVLFFACELAAEFEWRVKQAGHLNSKMRLVTAPWLALLEGDVWLSNARHANAMARRLSERITNLPGVRLLAPVQANGVFVELPAAVQARLREKGWRFYTFLGETGCRLMCAWDTTPDTVDRFAADIAATAMSR